MLVSSSDRVSARGVRCTLVPTGEVARVRRHREGAVGVSDPFHGAAPRGAARTDDDRVAHHEARQHPDAELAEEVAARQIEDVALRAASHRREQIRDLGLGEPDAVVAQDELVRRGAHGRDPDAAAPAVERTSSGDRVDGVLEEFAQEHAGARVDVATEEVDDTPEVDLELVGGGTVGHRAPRDRPCAGPPPALPRQDGRTSLARPFREGGGCRAFATPRGMPYACARSCLHSFAVPMGSARMWIPGSQDLRAVAQLAEQRSPKPQVAGSIPVRPARQRQLTRTEQQVG